MSELLQVFRDAGPKCKQSMWGPGTGHTSSNPHCLIHSTTSLPDPGLGNKEFMHDGQMAHSVARRLSWSSVKMVSSH